MVACRLPQPDSWLEVTVTDVDLAFRWTDGHVTALGWDYLVAARETAAYIGPWPVHVGAAVLVAGRPARVIAYEPCMACCLVERAGWHAWLNVGRWYVYRAECALLRWLGRHGWLATAEGMERQWRDLRRWPQRSTERAA